eukprot:CAMPEP_0181455386 /NCGR_PEP_ID=MMETSP1110-20121109/30732_1 /TAXON_ID=174948 /ORGANISM="Symbiodinium sp., Strain CCMP421" /LENGTH=135 /DNA_ID=CAMNT_0023579771 /DNA_START=144 /DNA_END=552 /DNA_ORIENTATION=+
MTKVNMSNTQQLMHGLTIGESSTGLNRSSATANDGMKTQGAALRGGKNEASRAGNSSLANSNQQSLAFSTSIAHMNVTCVDTTSTGALGGHAIAHMVTLTGLITDVSGDLINASWSAFTDRGTTTYVEAQNVCAP